MSIDAYTYKASDAYRLEVSKELINPASDTYNLIKIPKYAFLTDVWAEVITLDASSVTTIGRIGNGAVADPDRYIADAVFIGTAAGVKRGTAFYGDYFRTAAGAITATVTYGGGTLVFRVFAQFTVIHP